MPDQPYQPFQPAGQGQRPDLNSIYPQPRESTLSHSNNTIQPPASDPAVEMIRQKIQQLYADEPDAKQELVEAKHHTHPGSKHQQFMSELNASGKSMAEIQTAWHNYYISLPDHEKYEVWQEFYVQNNTHLGQPAAGPASTVQPVATQHQHHAQQQPQAPTPAEKLAAVQAPIAQQFSQALARGVGEPVTGEDTPPPAPSNKEVHHRVTRRHRALARKQSSKSAKAKEIHKRIVDTVKTAAADTGKGKLTRKNQLQSALFGLACGMVVLLIFLFGFFNEVIIAPFIQPSRQINDTPVIVDTASAVITGGTKIIIPKINLEIPVDYSQTTIDEKAIELALDNGVVHYPSTVKPGETGNAAFFGHSSNNIFNPGKFKFAFVLLHELQEGDIFYLNYGDKTYAYKVFKKHIVTPKQVEVLQATPGKTATATLITCDPPGTSINRLVVVGEQISPDPNSNGQPTTPTQTAGTDPGTSTIATTEAGLPGNGPTLWSRIVDRIF